MVRRSREEWRGLFEEHARSGLTENARRQLPLCIGDNYTRASGVAPNR